MDLVSLYELQFTSCIMKDSASFNPDSAEWQTLCYCSSDSKLQDFIKVLELADNFRIKLSSDIISDDFVMNYYYRVVVAPKKFLCLFK